LRKAIWVSKTPFLNIEKSGGLAKSTYEIKAPRVLKRKRAAISGYF
jgi:hypothetical protein